MTLGLASFGDPGTLLPQLCYFTVGQTGHFRQVVALAFNLSTGEAERQVDL